MTNALRVVVRPGQAEDWEAVSDLLQDGSLSLLSAAEYALTEGKVARAAELARESIRLSPSTPDLVAYAAIICEQAGDGDGAAVAKALLATLDADLVKRLEDDRAVSERPRPSKSNRRAAGGNRAVAVLNVMIWLLLGGASGYFIASTTQLPDQEIRDQIEIDGDQELAAIGSALAPASASALSMLVAVDGLADSTAKGFKSAASRVLVEAVRLATDAAWRDGDYNKVRENISYLMGRDSVTDTVSMYRLGIACVELGLHEEGLKWLKRAVKLMPGAFFEAEALYRIARHGSDGDARSAAHEIRTRYTGSIYDNSNVERLLTDAR